MSVTVETKPALSFGTPKMLFRSAYVQPISGEGTPWDIHPDGKRFLIMKPPGVTASTEVAPRPKINIVLNWFEELKQRVPAK